MSANWWQRSQPASSLRSAPTPSALGDSRWIIAPKCGIVFAVMLSELEIREALVSLDRALTAKGVKGEICLFGGAVMVLAFQARQSTRDVDAIFAPAALIRELAAEVGRDRGWEEGWLNDGVKGWLSSRQQLADAAAFICPDADAAIHAGYEVHGCESGWRQP